MHLSTYLDIFTFTVKGKNLDAATYVFLPKVFTLLWGILLIGGAMLFTDTKYPVVELGLKIASFTYGGLLGTFFLGLFFKHTTQRDAFMGFIDGILAMSAVLAYTRVDFTWHTLIGCIVTIAVGNIAHLFISRKT